MSHGCCCIFHIAFYQKACTVCSTISDGEWRLLVTIWSIHFKILFSLLQLASGMILLAMQFLKNEKSKDKKCMRRTLECGLLPYYFFQKVLSIFVLRIDISPFLSLLSLWNIAKLPMIALFYKYTHKKLNSCF